MLPSTYQVPNSFTITTLHSQAALSLHLFRQYSSNDFQPTCPPNPAPISTQLPTMGNDSSKPPSWTDPYNHPGFRVAGFNSDYGGFRPQYRGPGPGYHGPPQALGQRRGPTRRGYDLVAATQRELGQLAALEHGLRGTGA